MHHQTIDPRTTYNKPRTTLFTLPMPKCRSAPAQKTVETLRERQKMGTIGMVETAASRKRLCSSEEEPTGLVKACKRACSTCWTPQDSPVSAEGHVCMEPRGDCAAPQHVALLSAEGRVFMAPREVFGCNHCHEGPLPTSVRSDVLGYIVAALQAAPAISVRESVAENVELLAAAQVRCAPLDLGDTCPHMPGIPCTPTRHPAILS